MRLYGQEPRVSHWTPADPGAGDTRRSWRMNHRRVNHIRCLFLFLLLFTSTACVPHLNGAKVGQTRWSAGGSADAQEVVAQATRLRSCAEGKGIFTITSPISKLFKWYQLTWTSHCEQIDYEQRLFLCNQYKVYLNLCNYFETYIYKPHLSFPVAFHFPLLQEECWGL